MQQISFANKDEAPAPQPLRSRHLALTLILIVVAIGASAAALYLWRQNRSDLARLAAAQPQVSSISSIHA